MSSILVGTASPAHLESAAAAVAQGPLPDAVAAALREAFRRGDRGWEGQV